MTFPYHSGTAVLFLRIFEPFVGFEEEREPKESLTQEVWQLRKARLDDPRMYDRLADGWYSLPQYSSDDLAYGQELDMDIPHPQVWDPPRPTPVDYHYIEHDTT